MTTGSFPHDKFSSVYWIFTKLGHMIPLWKGKKPIYFGVIRSKVKITITINIIVDNRIVSARLLVLYIGSLPNLATLFPCGRRRTLFILGSLPLYRLIIYIDGRILWCTHFLLLSGLQTIRDIWDEEILNFKVSIQIYNSLFDKRNCISEYSQIKSAIPNTYVSILKKSGKFVQK